MKETFSRPEETIITPLVLWVFREENPLKCNINTHTHRGT